MALGRKLMGSSGKIAAGNRRSLLISVCAVSLVCGQFLVTSLAVAQTPETSSGRNSASVESTPSNSSSATDTWGTEGSEPNEPQREPDHEHENELAPLAASRNPAPEDTVLRIQPLESEPNAQSHLRYTLERIDVRGNSRTRTRVILRYLKYRPGDVIDVDDPELTLTRYRILGTGFFRDVQFALRKGAHRGQVVLVVDVVERNTIILNDVGMGLSADADNNGHSRPLTAYGGVDVAETNLAGTGITLGAAVALAQEQTAIRMRFLDPSFLGSPWMVSGTLLRNQARDFFGTTSQVDWVSYDGEQKRGSSYAVLDYTRFGGTLGFGRDLSISTQLWFYYRLETIEARRPILASEDRGQGPEPIEFDIRRDRSVLSSIRTSFQLDTRDHPFLPTRGWLVTTWGEFAMAPLGSDYDYQRFDVSASRWWQVRGTPHTLRLQLFAGAETGTVPFFEQYYVGDFTDFRAPRMLGLNFERRPPPDVLGTVVKEQRYGHYAAKLGFEYRIPVYRGVRSVYGIDLFLGAGIWGLINRRDIMKMPPGYHGLERLPVDLTGNVGFRMDTSAGGITFAFSNILGFVPLRGDGT